jgi:hypothetical protein
VNDIYSVRARFFLFPSSSTLRNGSPDLTHLFVASFSVAAVLHELITFAGLLA